MFEENGDPRPPTRAELWVLFWYVVLSYPINWALMAKVMVPLILAGSMGTGEPNKPMLAFFWLISPITLPFNVLSCVILVVCWFVVTATTWLGTHMF